MSLDYSGRNLRGKSFKGQNLTNADFSHADIRGANFTGAILRGANFSRAKAGLQKRQAIFLVFVSFLLAGLSGFLFILNGTLASFVLDNIILDNLVIGWVTTIITIIFFVAAVRQGIQFAFGTVAVAVALVLTVAGAEALALAVVFAIVFTLALAVAGVLAGALAGALTGPLAGALTGPLAGVLTGVLTRVLTGPLTLAVVVAGVVALAGALVSAYIGWRAMKGDEKYAFIRNIAIAFAAFGGTSCRYADLTNANFTSATLKNTDFRNATLTRTCLRNVKKLDYVRPGNTYLQYPQLRQVLVTGNGHQKNFDRQDLRGINLQRAGLVDVSLIGADLSKANLQDSDLSRAKLVQTQLNATDFTGATLTGAYIEDWNITTDTNFRGVRCEYVYMRLPTDDNPEPWRKPDNREEVFGDGEFGDFIKPIVDTLDLYHNQGVDPRAIAISFKELAENNPDADLELVAMEKRGVDKFLIRAKVAPEADKSELNQQYFETYNHLKTLSPAEQIQHYLDEISEKNKKIELKDKEIELQQKQLASFENMVGTALGRSHSTYNLNQATAISQHIPYVIGMTQAIGDRAAIEFAVGFYSALGAGESIDFAYKLGCNAMPAAMPYGLIAIAGISENLTPVIHPK
ncbi:MAG: pentapeptide repeat-containing protein [Mastigocoleus sp. MO_167.B18]|nr:pentapeptide repeat-containing protein [Mastigocoleus sp. MO_167.B18]